MGLPSPSKPCAVTLTFPNMFSTVTVLYLNVPGVIFDLASFNFQVPMCGSAAKQASAAKKQNARVNAIVFVFMRPIESGFHFSSTFLSSGRRIWIVDAHRDDGKRFVVRAEENLSIAKALPKERRPPSRSHSATSTYWPQCLTWVIYQAFSCTLPSPNRLL